MLLVWTRDQDLFESVWISISSLISLTILASSLSSFSLYSPAGMYSPLHVLQHKAKMTQSSLTGLRWSCFWTSGFLSRASWMFWIHFISLYRVKLKDHLAVAFLIGNLQKWWSKWTLFTFGMENSECILFDTFYRWSHWQVKCLSLTWMVKHWLYIQSTSYLSS